MIGFREERQFEGFLLWACHLRSSVRKPRKKSRTAVSCRLKNTDVTPHLVKGSPECGQVKPRFVPERKYCAPFRVEKKFTFGEEELNWSVMHHRSLLDYVYVPFTYSIAGWA